MIRARMAEVQGCAEVSALQDAKALNPKGEVQGRTEESAQQGC